MMKCAKVKKLLSAYADGLVSPRVHEELSEHIAVCKSCAREVEMTTQMLAAVSELGSQKTLVDLWPVVQVRIEEMDKCRPGALQKMLTPVLRPVIALPVVAAAAISIVMLVQTEHQPKNAVYVLGSSEMAAYIEEYSQFRSKQSFADTSGLIIAQLEKPAGKEE